MPGRSNLRKEGVIGALRLRKLSIKAGKCCAEDCCSRGSRLVRPLLTLPVRNLTETLAVFIPWSPFYLVQDSRQQVAPLTFRMCLSTSFNVL